MRVRCMMRIECVYFIILRQDAVVNNLRVCALIPSPTQIFTSCPMNVVFKVILIIQI